MNPDDAIDFSREAIRMCVMIGGPILAVTLVVGLLVGIGQAVTQVHDQSFSTVPKILLVLVTIGLALPWFSDTMIDFSAEAFGKPVMMTGDFASSNGVGIAQVESDKTRQTSVPIRLAAATLPQTDSAKRGSIHRTSIPKMPAAPSAPNLLTPSPNPFQLPSYRYEKRDTGNHEG